MWKSWTSFLPLCSSLLFPSLIVLGVKPRTLCCLGKCSGHKLYLQTDVELDGTDAEITGRGQVFRKLNVKPLYAPDFLDMEMKTGVHRKTYIKSHQVFFIMHSSCRQHLLPVYSEWANKIKLIYIIAFLFSAKESLFMQTTLATEMCVSHMHKENNTGKSGSICCCLELLVLCTYQMVLNPRVQHRDEYPWGVGSFWICSVCEGTRPEVIRFLLQVSVFPYISACHVIPTSVV